MLREGRVAYERGGNGKGGEGRGIPQTLKAYAVIVLLCV